MSDNPFKPGDIIVPFRDYDHSAGRIVERPEQGTEGTFWRVLSVSGQTIRYALVRGVFAPWWDEGARYTSFENETLDKPELPPDGERKYLSIFRLASPAEVAAMEAMPPSVLEPVPPEKPFADMLLADIRRASRFQAGVWQADIDNLWDEEHGNTNPEQLGIIDSLVESKERTPHRDLTILKPLFAFGLRTLDHPDFVRRYWRALRAVSDEDGALADFAFEQLTTHPSGALRAAVLAPDEGEWFPSFLEEPRFLDWIERAAQDDPHPEVRAATADFVHHFAGGAELALDRVRNDPAFEVRLRFAPVLAGADLALEQRREALAAALLAPENEPRLAGFLLAYAGTGRQGYDPAVAAMVLSVLRSHLARADALMLWPVVLRVVPTNGRELDTVAAYFAWLSSEGPFATGEQLTIVLGERSRDLSVDVMFRVLCLVALQSFGALLEQDRPTLAALQAESRLRDRDRSDIVRMLRELDRR